VFIRIISRELKIEKIWHHGTPPEEGAEASEMLRQVRQIIRMIQIGDTPPKLATAADLGLDEQQVKHPDYKKQFHRKNGSHMQPQNYKQNKR